MAFALPPLPYDRAALEPHMSAETLDFHHGKHHLAYIDKTNALIEEKGLPDRTLVETVRYARETGNQLLFNNAAQAWNHSFFWQSLAPSGTQPSSRLAQLIERDFGSTDALLEMFKDEAVSHFASGWAWLILENGALKITSLHDAETPLVREGCEPLLTLDLWEHAYYVDYRNERPQFVEAVLGNILNWEFASRNLDGLGAGRADQEG